VRDLAAATTIGALVLAVTAVPPIDKQRPDRIEGARRSLLNVAGIAGTVWVWSGLATLVFIYAEVAGLDPFAPGGLIALGTFVTDLELGRALLVSSVLAAVVTLGSLASRSTTTAALWTAVGVLALWPLATTGHAAGDANHDVAVNAQMAHLVGISVWVGGLASLALVRRRLPDGQLQPVVARYSRLAAWSAAAVAISGATAALLRISDVNQLSSPYAVLVMTKVAALSVLLAAGAWHRKRSVGLLHEAHRQAPFIRLVAGELVVMSLAVGVGVALSRTPPPNDASASSPAESLLGFPLPPALGVDTFVSQWRFDTLWGTAAIFAVVLYVAGMARLRRRGDRWPVGRLIAWIIGNVLLLWATSGSPGVYGDVLFSMHMLQHMVVATVSPAFLVLGAPMTLALRAIPARRDGSRGPREWLLLALHSRYLRVFAHPIVAAGMFVVSLVVFYSSGLFELSLRSHTMHQLMVLHFLVTGYLLAFGICGLDPGPPRVAHPLRVVTLMASFAFHALFSVSLMSKSEVLAEDWYTALGRTWGPTLLRDQEIGGALQWVAGDYAIAVLGVALIWNWFRSDAREARRYDRRAARDDDAELRRYNEMLRRLNETQR
jgi:cytochrome c oxidase assembly factor CtaG/putative copper export protein